MAFNIFVAEKCNDSRNKAIDHANMYDANFDDQWNYYFAGGKTQQPNIMWAYLKATNKTNRFESPEMCIFAVDGYIYWFVWSLHKYASAVG